MKPSGKATKPYSSHGIPKDATKAELKAIRSNPKSSKGKKQLAHWKLNMHSEGKSAYDRINDRFKKLSGGQSLEDRAAYYKKEKEKGEKKLAQFRKDNNYNSKTGQYEEFVLEANKPNNPKLWAAKKAAAKAKFDVYPSAYANGWAVPVSYTHLTLPTILRV